MREKGREKKMGTQLIFSRPPAATAGMQFVYTLHRDCVFVPPHFDDRRWLSLFPCSRPSHPTGPTVGDRKPTTALHYRRRRRRYSSLNFKHPQPCNFRPQNRLRFLRPTDNQHPNLTFTILSSRTLSYSPALLSEELEA